VADLEEGLGLFRTKRGPKKLILREAPLFLGMDDWLDTHQSHWFWLAQQPMYKIKNYLSMKHIS